MGKTAVFVVVTLERITTEDGLQCVVIVHTRELAYQVAKEFERFKAYLPGITVSSIYGGVALPQQEKMLQDDPPHVIVACPGRLKVLIQKKTVDVSKLKIFVIDEVDKVLEKADMRSDVQEIFYKTPKTKQTMVFSATLPEEIRSTVMKFVKNVSLPRRTVPKNDEGREQDVPSACHGWSSTQCSRVHRHRGPRIFRSCQWMPQPTALVHHRIVPTRGTEERFCLAQERAIDGIS